MRILTEFVKCGLKQNFGYRHSSGYLPQILKNVNTVDISDAPNIKYLLIKIYEHGESAISKTILRGYEAELHTPIYYKTRRQMAEMGLCTQGLGGGILLHDKECKVFTITGACKTFGKADPYKTRSILQRQFLDYKIKIVN